MKHKFKWIASAALLAFCAGCATVEEPEIPAEPRAIAFSGRYGFSDAFAPTRSVALSPFVKDDEIKIFASYTENPDDAAFTSNFMNNQIVKFDGDVWSYSPIKYWPNDGKLTFRGYFPSSVKTDENYPGEGMITATHKCITGFERLYGVETSVLAENGNLSGAVSDDGKLQLAFTPLLNTVNFNAKAENGLFDEIENPPDEYTYCHFLLLSFRVWGFYKEGLFTSKNESWKGVRNKVYTKQSPLDLTEYLDKKNVEQSIPGYVYNPKEGYCIDKAVIISEGEDMLNIFNRTLHLIPRDAAIHTAPEFEITYVVLTQHTAADGTLSYKESGIVTRKIPLAGVLDKNGLIKKLININLDFTIDGVTVTRFLEDYIYKPMF